MNTIIAGSRDCTTIELLFDALEECPWEVTEVVCGMAPGADMLGFEFAELAELPKPHEFPANWRPDGPKGKLDRGAGYKRNEQMAKFAQACIVLWDGTSKGSKNMIDLAIKYKLLLLVYKYKEYKFETYNCKYIGEK
jgi:hypothetical protein